MRGVLSRAALAVAVSLFVGLAMGQGAQWPIRPVTWVAVTGPGGNSDVLARLIARPLGAALKVPVVVINKPGGGGTIGGSFVVKAPPDGYTLLGGSVSTNVLSPLINRNTPYDAQRDLAPVTLLGISHSVLVVPATSPFKTVGDIIQAANASPGALSYASPGIGGTQHVSGELFKHLAGIQLTHVPNSRGSAITDVVGGHVSMMFEGPVVLPYIQSGKVRALAVTSKQRLAQLPDVPTMEEAGLRGFEVMGWQGVFAPAGTPRAVVSRLQREIASILGTAEVRRQLDRFGLTPSGMTPDEVVAFQKAEIEKWSAVLQSSGIKAE